MPFVTFEGVEGCGKSTQLRRLADRLRGLDLDVRTTREPGGTPLGEKLRALLMDPAQGELDPIAEWLLFEADRRQHIVDVIRPGLEAGAWILCDRFADSTEAYQAAGRGIDAALITSVDERVRDGILPDLTLLDAVAVVEGLARARRRDAREGRFEAEELAFHERVRLRFGEISRREPQRVTVVSGDGDVESVFADTWRIVAERFHL